MEQELDPLTEAAKAMFARFIREPDPIQVDRRWARIREASRANWIADASIAVETFLKLSR